MKLKFSRIYTNRDAGKRKWMRIGTENADNKKGNCMHVDWGVRVNDFILFEAAQEWEKHGFVDQFWSVK